MAGITEYKQGKYMVQMLPEELLDFQKELNQPFWLPVINHIRINYSERLSDDQLMSELLTLLDCDGLNFVECSKFDVMHFLTRKMFEARQQAECIEINGDSVDG